MHPWIRRLVTLALIGVIVSPAIDRSPSDGFPLSTYPMFAVDRGERTAISTAVGLTESGRTVRLSPGLLAGTDEPILAVRTARQMVHLDPDRWCAEIAGRVASHHRSSGEDPITAVSVVTETHDARASLVDGADPVGVLTHASCAVPA